MYNLVEYSSNYSETTESLWIYSNDEATNVNNDIENIDDFTSFKYKSKLLGNTVAQLTPDEANGILKNATVAVPLIYLRSLKIQLNNCKVQLKSWWTKYCFLAAAGNDNANDNANNIIFTIKDTKLYVPVVTLSANENQKLSQLLSKGFEKSVYWNEYTTTSETNVVGVNRLFALIYLNRNNDVKQFIAPKYYPSKGITKNYNVIINGKSRAIDSNIKSYRKKIEN